MAAGAAAMVLTRCLTPGQAYRAIAGVIPLGVAMQRTGSAELLAGWLERLVAGWNQFAVLLALYAIVAVITEFMSDAGTTALVAPLEELWISWLMKEVALHATYNAMLRGRA